VGGKVPTFAKIQTSGLILEEVDSGSLNSLIRTEADPQNISLVRASGASPLLTAATITNSPNIKKMVAGFGPMNAYTPVAKSRVTGKIIPLDSDDPYANFPIGILKDSVTYSDDLVDVYIGGVNLPGILFGKGFNVGDVIYSSSIPGGMTNDLTGVNPAEESILRLGVADCGAGEANGVATDLILSMEIVSSI
jgi:hypothetical protein